MYIVLVEASSGAAVAGAPLTGQSAWTVPAGQNWSLHLWDGAGAATPPMWAAARLADICGGVAFVYWWSRVEAGYGLFRKDTPLADHSWPPDFDFTGWAQSNLDAKQDADDWDEPDPLHDYPPSGASPEVAAAELETAFRRPSGYRDALARHLAEPHQDAHAALHRLLELLGLDPSALALDQEGLTIWAAAQPGVRRTPELGRFAAIRHFMREAPPTNAWDRAERERPTWYRLLNLAVGLGMAAGTAILFFNWRWGYMSGWWVLLGMVATLAYLGSARRGRKRPQ